MEAARRVQYWTLTDLMIVLNCAVYGGEIRVLKILLSSLRPQGALRSKSFSSIDEWHTDFTLGYKRNDKYLLLGQLFHARRKSIEQDGFSVPIQQRVKLKLSAVYEYKKNRHVQIGYEQAIAGRNIVRERGLSVGTWLKY